MKKWYVITGILACLLVISVVVILSSLSKVDELGTQVQLQREEGRQTGYTTGYEDGLSTGREQGYDAGYYDGWYQGQWCYEHHKFAVSDLGKDWRQYWKEQGIYDKEYRGPLPD